MSGVLRKIAWRVQCHVIDIESGVAFPCTATITRIVRLLQGSSRLRRKWGAFLNLRVRRHDDTHRARPSYCSCSPKKGVIIARVYLAAGCLFSLSSLLIIRPWSVMWIRYRFLFVGYIYYRICGQLLKEISLQLFSRKEMTMALRQDRIECLSLPRNRRILLSNNERPTVRMQHEKQPPILRRAATLSWPDGEFKSLETC